MSTHIASIDALDVKGRCETASVSLVRDEPGYEPEVLLPDDDWEPLTPQQIGSLCPPADAGAGVMHEIIRLPVSTDELARIRESSAEYSVDHDQTIAYDPFGGRYASTFIGHVDSSAGQRTTTMDQRLGKRNGMHLDNFDQLPLGDRRNSRRRLAVNLGPGHRFLILATIDVLDIAAGRQILGAYPRTADVREFVRSGGALSCVRIRIEPGEGYLAPTELVPHDGSTSGIDVPSRIAFWLGHWPVGVLPSAVG